MNILVNLLTLSRAISGPIIFALLVVLNRPILALTITIISSLTDYLDGYLARKYKVVSNFGKTFDPLADKVVIVFCFISLTIILDSTFVAFCSALIISREILVTGVREFAASSGLREVLAVSFIAKIKTALQLFTICSYQLSLILDSALAIFINHWILLLATLITMKTGVDYFQKLQKQMS